MKFAMATVRSLQKYENDSLFFKQLYVKDWWQICYVIQATGNYLIKL